ncbi:hypothetical protein [Serratia marcescens]|uniref:hypothetical protein n=1 Tax=Serratia marcescens TaxID=615 RepID=UPI001EB5B903|nr:hypothetical protein [Serratia marcescens]EGT0451665.1 hypothetical protein [Serratia marcescens]MCM2650989.1 hypothetical protein [Serratia marcescens]
MQLLDRPIAFQPSFVGLGAGVTGAVLLSQLVYWPNRMDGWFYKTQAELTTETVLSRYEQEGARKKLVTAGVLEEDRRGVPAKLYFRVNKNRLEALLIQYAENQQTGMRKFRGQVCRKPPSQIGEIPHSFIQEITQRILQRLLQRRNLYVSWLHQQTHKPTL